MPTSSLIILLRRPQLVGRLEIMPKHQLGVEQPLQPADHVQTADPGVVVARQPAMRVAELVVLLDVELVRRPDEGAVLLEVDLHDHQPRRVARRVVQRDALRQVEVVVVERRPLQLLQVHVVRQIHAQVRPRGHSPACVLELLLVHVDGHVRADEVLQPARVVEMQVPDDDGFDVLDVVPSRLDGGRQLLVLAVLDAGEDVGDGGRPFLRQSASHAYVIDY